MIEVPVVAVIALSVVQLTFSQTDGSLQNSSSARAQPHIKGFACKLLCLSFFVCCKHCPTVKVWCSVLQAPPQADGSVPLYMPLSLGLLGGTEESVMQALSGIVQEKSCIVCSMVVAVQVPKSGYANFRADLALLLLVLAQPAVQRQYINLSLFFDL